jgi:molecular chaperone GrpE
MIRNFNTNNSQDVSMSKQHEKKKETPSDGEETTEQTASPDLTTNAPGASGQPGEGPTEATSGKSAERGKPAESGSEKAKGPANESSAIIELGARLVSMEAENSNLKDQYLRKAADFENFRKRMVREKQEAIDFANQTLLLDIIPVLDDFERAIKSSEAARDYENFHEGISMIEKRLVSLLETKWGLARFDSAGQVFDPNRHEALMVEKTAEVTEATVGEDLMKGYLLKDRVVRSAKVKVLMPLDETNGA